MRSVRLKCQKQEYGSVLHYTLNRFYHIKIIKEYIIWIAVQLIWVRGSINPLAYPRQCKKALWLCTHNYRLKSSGIHLLASAAQET